MKSAKTLLLIPLFVVVYFLFTVNQSSLTLNQVSSVFPDRFLFGAMESHNDIVNNFTKVDSLGFNVNAKYVGAYYDNTLQRYLPLGMSANDKITEPVSSYMGSVRSQLLSAYSVNNMRTLLQRPKIEWLLHGQRSDYQCEDIQYVDTNVWFYSFQSPNHIGNDLIDNSTFGNGQYVRYCQMNPNQTDGGAGWVVSKLRSNTEQCNRYLGEERWRGDSDCDWIFKPRIRIDSAFANNPDNFIKPVCRVDINNEDGVTVKSIDIKVRNFKVNLTTRYLGNYIEEFFFIPYGDLINQIYSNDLGEKGVFSARGDETDENKVTNKTDIKIFWYGNCDMWIDYVRVDNDVADRLLKGNDPDFEVWIEDEVKDIALYPASQSEPLGLKFYVEYLDFNQLPCAAYVNQKLKEYSALYGNGDTIDLIADLDWKYSQHVPLDQAYRINNPEHIYKNYIQKVGFRQIFAESYPLTTTYNSPTGYNHSKIPNTLPISSGLGVFAEATSPGNYDTWLQDNFDRKPFILEPGGGWTDPQGEFPQLPGYNRYWLDLCNKVSKLANIPFIHMPQAHLWHWPTERRREPTNEELDFIANIAISYGTKGLIFFWFPSHGTISNDPNAMFGVGMTNPENGNLRTANVYGQTDRKKWEVMKGIRERISLWETYLLSFGNVNNNSYYFANSNDRNNLLNNSFINNIYSYKPLPTDLDEPDFDSPESNSNTYIQIATFENGEQFEKFFMIVNRRCSPYIPSEDENGGRRFIKFQIDQNSNQFSGFNNWAIIDLETDQTVLTFNKNNPGLLNLGWFNPGQGKLYKIAPVMQEGGTLVTDEEFGGLEFNCEGNIYNNGYDINIGTNTIINFTYNTKIEMTGGNFICNSGNDVDVNYFRGLNNEKWEGLKFTGCPVVNIQATEFDDLISPGHPDDFNFALKFVDCEYMLIRYNFFSGTNTSPRVGAVSIDYLNEPNWENQALDVFGNMFDYQSLVSPVIRISNYAFTQSPVLMRFNHFKGNNNSNNAVFLNNVTGGVIRNNKIEGFQNGIHSAVSYIDFYNNEVSNTGYENYNLNLNAGSYFNLKTEMGNYYLGGYNKLNTSGDLASNIFLQNSYFDADKGFNVFNVKSGYAHFTGTFNDDYFTTNDISIVDNCFKADNTPDYLNQDLSWEINICALNFYTGDNNCEIYSPESYEIVYFGDIEDTLWTKFVGIGGGSNENKGSNKVTEVTTGNLFKLKSDSLKVLMRKRKFNDVTRIGNEILNTFPDSAGIINVIQPLYFATLVTDDSIDTKITNYKTKLESIISSNGNNISLVLRCNYFIQKCKVKLGEYQSALSGFQQIMQNFPYSWEGVVAGWDYSATQLLAGGGSGQGVMRDKNINHELRELDESDENKKYNEIDNAEFGLDELKQIEAKKAETFDDKITKHVSRSLTESKTNAVKELKKEEEKIIQFNNISKKSGNGKYSLTKSELQEIKKSEKNIEQKRVINETIKPRKPNSISEQINFVNNDIKKIILGSGLVTGDNIKGMETPVEYTLHQNYPNPFNPITKISFSLPKDVKVTLVIYDILGREITKLVNNELKTAGSHTFDFNASKLASGIYFYSLMTDDFKQTKKMLMIK